MNKALAELVIAEERGRLWEQRILDYPVWPLLRLERYRQALLSGETAIRTSTADDSRSMRQRLFQAMTHVMKQGKLSSSSPDIWVISSSTYRRRVENGDYPCIFVDDLNEQLGSRLQFIEINSANLPLEGRANCFLLDGYLRYIHLAATLAARQLPHSVIPSDVRASFYPTPPSELIRRAVYGNLLERLGRRLIEARRPSCAFVLCAYGSTVPLQRALGAAGVPMIEVQHGIIHESHPGYVFSENVPKLAHRPDHLLLFGQHFGELLDRDSPGLRTPWTVAGHPWLRQARARAMSIQRPNQHEADAVVVFGQYDPQIQQMMQSFLPELRRALPTSMRLVYKPHPREPLGALRPIVESSKITLAASSDDAYRLLAQCRAAVTVYSTLAIEALAFPCLSIVLRSPFWSDDIRAFVEQGVLIAADSAADVVEALARPPHHAEHLAERLFGISTPPLDFERLVSHVTSLER